ncbi:peptidoglycan DD-metalloendopeptidase family protein [Exiguobacterium sp. SL-9]|uniref:peptidoglycan DD-metalloendopeptidase family protein n=1 Tax=Exiguobacterium sp. SL-9 TaxID=2510963 RepID=UPI00103B37D0|nr:peptidoglycan DD-metalloendopeptidase family protein [Exiguobacterium sp. SL-9]TCI21355.1 peptidase M23 [Exiguobacterium sp. SL-9]
MWKQLLVTVGTGALILAGTSAVSADQLTPQDLVKTTKSLQQTEQRLHTSKQSVAQAKHRAEAVEEKVNAIQKEIDHANAQLASYDTALNSETDNPSLFKQVLSTVLPSAQAEAATSEKNESDLKAKQAATTRSLEQLENEQAKVEAEHKKARSSHSAAYKQLKGQAAQLKDLKRQTAAMAPEKFMMPATGRLSQGYGPASGQFGYTFHNGLDLAANVGTPIYAAAAGTVTTVKSGGPYGKHVFIEHEIDGQKWTTVYAHMHKIEVKKGQTLLQGEGIGQIGNTGNSSGPHLHFEVHQGEYAYSSSSAGNTVNPMDVTEVLGGASPIQATY